MNDFTEKEMEIKERGIYSAITKATSQFDIFLKKKAFQLLKEFGANGEFIVSNSYSYLLETFSEIAIEEFQVGA